MNKTLFALICLFALMGFLIYSLMDLQYAHSLGLKQDDICLICDVLDNYVRFR